MFTFNSDINILLVYIIHTGFIVVFQNCLRKINTSNLQCFVYDLFTKTVFIFCIFLFYLCKIIFFIIYFEFVIYSKIACNTIVYISRISYIIYSSNNFKLVTVHADRPKVIKSGFTKDLRTIWFQFDQNVEGSESCNDIFTPITLNQIGYGMITFILQC